MVSTMRAGTDTQEGGKVTPRRTTGGRVMGPGRGEDPGESAMIEFAAEIGERAPGPARA